MGLVDQKVAIVTGAGRGIGRGIALRLGAEGAKVVVASRTEATVERVVAEIHQAGGEAIGITCDVGHEDQINAMVGQAVERFGPIDILVNVAQGFGTETNPAGSPVNTPLETYDNEQWEYSFRTGATATLWAMKAVFPSMKQQGGRIINFGSEYGMVGWPGAAAYNATKEAIRALTRTAAREWGKHRINVHCVNPMIATESSADQLKIIGFDPEVTAAQVPLGRWGDPFDDGGGLVLFLVGEQSKFLTGMTFPLDGGMTIRA